jgi:hypothetical protein
VIAKRPPIPDDLVGCRRRAAVKDDDVVTLPLERVRDVWTDEAAASGEKGSHNW